MAKLKTKSAAKKRFKKLPGGKIKRAKAYRRHILTKKTTKCKRHLRSGGYVCQADKKAVMSMLPN